MEITAADIKPFGIDERDIATVRGCLEYAAGLLPQEETILAFFISRQGGYPDDLFFFTRSYMIRFPEFQKAISRGARECSFNSLTYSVIGLKLEAQEKTDFLPKSLTVEIAMKDTEDIRIHASGTTAGRLEQIVRESLIPHLRR